MAPLRRAVLAALLLATLVVAPEVEAGAPVSDVDTECLAPCTFEVTFDGENVPTPKVQILLPADYDHESDVGHPVVLLLHGAGDGYETWVANTDVESFAADLGAIVVMPDGGGKRGDAGWYSDWVDGSADWASFHIETVLPWVDDHLNTAASREHRAVMGLSMGGFGAMSYSARHPDLFSAAASFSGALDTQYLAPASGIGFAAAHDQFGTPDERVWGPQTTELQESAWTEHNPTARARRGDLAHLSGNLWITTGTGTPGGPAGENPTGYPVEAFIWQLNQSFKVALEQSGTGYHDLSYLGGGHDWPHWEHALHLVLPEVIAAIS